MGNGVMAKGPSHRAHPRLYQVDSSRIENAALREASNFMLANPLCCWLGEDARG
jgi:hypothetical protein